MLLREAIAQFYHDKPGAKINPARVIVTAGDRALTLPARLVNHGGEAPMRLTRPGPANSKLRAGSRRAAPIPSFGRKRSPAFGGG